MHILIYLCRPFTNSRDGALVRVDNKLLKIIFVKGKNYYYAG
jgi:hypothetical protein